MASRKSIQRRSLTPEEEDMEDDIPLHHKRVFGAGLHKKTIAFVPAAHGNLNSTRDSSESAKKPASSIANLYLSMVLPRDATQAPAEVEICQVCKLPLRSDSRPPKEGEDGLYAKSAHETSLAHQICVPHSHPPSALDRSRMGLAVLESHGWDPDSRKGLGAAQQGIKFPIKPKPKDNKVGLGIEVPKNLPPPKEKRQLLDAGKVRKQYREERRKAARLQRQLFGDDKLERYLGPGADL